MPVDLEVVPRGAVDGSGGRWFLRTGKGEKKEVRIERAGKGFRESGKPKRQDN